MKATGVFTSHATRLFFMGLIAWWSAWASIHIVRAMPSAVRTFTDMAANPAAGGVLVLLIGGGMFIFAVLIAGSGYFAIRWIWSNRRR